MPDDFKSCKGVVAAWGLGGDAFAFPADAGNYYQLFVYYFSFLFTKNLFHISGYPVGEKHGGATYYMFEVHYDNPGYHSGVVLKYNFEIYQIF